MLTTELCHLASNLRHLAEAVGQEATVDFEPLEPGMALHFKMNLRGEISVDYYLRDLFQGIHAPQLRGSFLIDQTFLTPLADALISLATGSQ